MSFTMTAKTVKASQDDSDFCPIEDSHNQNNKDINLNQLENYDNTAKLMKRRKFNKCEGNNNLSKEELEYINYRQLVRIEDAPEYLQHNPFILTGYRKFLPTNLCWESIFWWTNETLNIWTHLFGFFLCIGLSINDLALIHIHATVADKVVVALLLACFQVCMVSSALYHTFSCHSEECYNRFLMYDLFGVALSLLAIYTSGVYYAFWCHHEWKTFYLITVTLIFVVAMIVQLPYLGIPHAVRTLVFIGWAAYGVLPTLHWTWIMGGFDNPMVQLLFPRVIGMYIISGIAFFIYYFKIPERWFPGKVDYIGHSHQWWHIFVLLALLYWHNSGMIYVEYRMNHGCANSMRIF